MPKINNIGASIDSELKSDDSIRGQTIHAGSPFKAVSDDLEKQLHRVIWRISFAGMFI